MLTSGIGGKGTLRVGRPEVCEVAIAIAQILTIRMVFIFILYILTDLREMVLMVLMEQKSVRK